MTGKNFGMSVSVLFYSPVLLCCLAACGARHPALSRPAAAARAAALAELGGKLFRDPSISGSGLISCATCHDPQRAFGPPPGLAAGNRAAPSLRYLQSVPHFTEHYFDEDKGDDSIDNGPTGGLTWDGRVDRGRDQARIPLLAESEMAGGSERAIAARAGNAPYAGELRKLARGGDLFATVLQALETYQQNEHEFYPYSSRFDAWLAGTAALSIQETRGFELFKDPARGNCSSCHSSEVTRAGIAPQFTDYGFIALGIPDNSAYHDLGLCGPERKDLTGHPEYCGRFRTPTLRNVATRTVFFHNGSVHTLREAVAFYAERETKPDNWPSPAEYRNNIEKGAPFSNKPALSEAEIDDIVAFLNTLTDITPALPAT